MGESGSFLNSLSDLDSLRWYDDEEDDDTDDDDDDDFLSTLASTIYHKTIYMDWV